MLASQIIAWRSEIISKTIDQENSRQKFELQPPFANRDQGKLSRLAARYPMGNTFILVSLERRVIA